MNYGALFNLLLGVAASIIPLYREVSFIDVDRTSKEVIMMLVLLVIFACSAPSRVRSAPLIIKLLPVYLLASFVFNQWAPITDSVVYQSIMAGAGVFAFVFIYERIDIESFNYFSNAFCVGVLIQALLGIFEACGFNLYNSILEWVNRPSQREWIKEWVNVTGMKINLDKALTGKLFVEDRKWQTAGIIGSLGNGNIYGAFMAMGMCFFMRGYWSLALPVIAVMAYMSNSLTSAIAAMAALLSYLWIARKKSERFFFYGVGLVGIAAIIMAYYYNTGLDSGRFIIWKDAINRVQLHGPLAVIFGKGLGWYADLKLMFFSQLATNEHSIYITIFSAFGVVGLAWMLLILARAIGAHQMLWVFPAIVVISANGVANFLLHQASIIIPLIMIISVALITNKRCYGRNLDW